MTFLTALALFVSLPSVAMERPKAALLPDAAAYAYADDAATAALRKAMPLSGTLEYGGAILESKGRFYFTEPVTSGRTGEISFSVLVPSTHRIAGIYHTHPDESEDTLLFSDNDVAQAKSLGARSCIGVLRDRSIRVYDPGFMRTHRRAQAGTRLSGAEIAAGEVIFTGVPL